MELLYFLLPWSNFSFPVKPIQRKFNLLRINLFGHPVIDRKIRTLIPTQFSIYDIGTDKNYVCEADKEFEVPITYFKIL